MTCLSLKWVQSNYENSIFSIAYEQFFPFFHTDLTFHILLLVQNIIRINLKRSNVFKHFLSMFFMVWWHICEVLHSQRLESGGERVFNHNMTTLTCNTHTFLNHWRKCLSSKYFWRKDFESAQIITKDIASPYFS